MSDAVHPPQVGLACVWGHHIFMEIYDEDRHIGGWCLWCGTGAFDPDRITDDNQPIGFVPRFELHVPDGWHRQPTDP